MSRPPALLLTCEHGGAAVPARWREVMAGAEPVLRTHRAYDAGALAVARALARRLGAPLVASTVTRLLVDLNRSEHNPRRFSEWTAGLPAAQRRALDDTIAVPHRGRIDAALAQALRESGRVLHVAVHSFTPVLGSTPRDFDVGLLYDPGRAFERAVAAAWVGALAPVVQGVRRNAPYRGVADGLTRALRMLHPNERYAGLELELNQRCLVDGRFSPALVSTLRRTLRSVVESA